MLYTVSATWLPNQRGAALRVRDCKSHMACDCHALSIIYYYPNGGVHTHCLVATVERAVNTRPSVQDGKLHWCVYMSPWPCYNDKRRQCLLAGTV